MTFSVTAGRALLFGMVCGLLVSTAPPRTSATQDAPHGGRSHLRCAARAGVLVVRSRAGLRPHLRSQLFAAYDAEELTHNDALGASVIRVPAGHLGAVERALRRSGYFKTIERDYLADVAQTPNDPEFVNEWGVQRIGATTAWDMTLGSSAVVVAILDTGVDPNHPDLRNQLVPGYDFQNNDADPSDDHGHGTRMAGIVAAQAFNGIGLAGIAPNCKIMPVKVMGADGGGAYSTIADGIVYAADHGARVINLSLAGGATSSTLQSAVDYATARGAVVVAAAGNAGTGDPAYPAAFPNAVAVSASDQNDNVASFSNFGSWIRLAAPGTDIVTTNWSSTGTPAYAGSSGTSPAAAVASGAFALLLAVHPELSSADAVSVLTGSAHDLGTSGWDPYSGWGRINIAAALGANSVQAPPPAPSPAPNTSSDRRPPSVGIMSPMTNALVYGDTAVDVAAFDEVGVTRVDLLVDNSYVASDTSAPFSFIWDTSTVAPGKHSVRARAYDAAGNAKMSRTVKVLVTHGVGMAVRRAKLATPRRSRSGSSLALSAIFALPEDVALDPSSNSFGITLSGTHGAVLDTAAQPLVLTAAVVAFGHFKAKAVDPNGAVLNVALTRPKNLPTYTLTISGTGLSLANADALMSLNVVINGAILSQSVSFRQPTGSSFVYP